MGSHGATEERQTENLSLFSLWLCVRSLFYPPRGDRSIIVSPPV
jgi:hypothetical protein